MRIRPTRHARVASFAFSSRGDIGQHACRKTSNIPLSRKNREIVMWQNSSKTRHSARIGFEPRPISRKIVQPEIAACAGQPLADLAADFAEAGPAQLELRQRPRRKAVHSVSFKALALTGVVQSRPISNSSQE